MRDWASEAVRRRRGINLYATFHDFDPLALWGFLTSGSSVRCPPRRSLVAEG